MNSNRDSVISANNVGLKSIELIPNEATRSSGLNRVAQNQRGFVGVGRHHSIASRAVAANKEFGPYQTHL